MVEKIPNQGRVPNHQRGTAKLALTLAALSFPVRRETLIEKAGNREVEIEEGVRVPLANFFQTSNVQDLKTLSHAVRIAGEHWADAIEGTGLPGGKGGESRAPRVREGAGKPKGKPRKGKKTT